MLNSANQATEQKQVSANKKQEKFVPHNNWGVGLSVKRELNKERSSNSFAVSATLATVQTFSPAGQTASAPIDNWGVGLSAKRDLSKERSSHTFATTAESANVQTSFS